MWMLNRAPRQTVPSAPLDVGDGFLMRQGYTVVWCGWQHDVPAVDGLMRIHVPEARRAGLPISGKLLVKFQPNVPSQVQLLSDRLHRPYPTNNLDDSDAVLQVYDADDVPPQVIPRGQWSFAKLDDGRVVADASHIYLASGFVPGKQYEVIYTTTGAPIVGLGLLTARDAVAFLRYGTVEGGNPCAANVRHAYAFGASQSGRYLREFLYLGLNEDEQQRPVFDGLLVHIAGGKRGGDFNQRFGQPSSSSRMSDLFPFHDTAQTDPATGRTDGLLDRLAACNRLPKVFFTQLLHRVLARRCFADPYERGGRARLGACRGGPHLSLCGDAACLRHNAADGCQPTRRLSGSAHVQLRGLPAIASRCAVTTGSVGDAARRSSAKLPSASRRPHGDPAGRAGWIVYGDTGRGLSGASTARERSRLRSGGRARDRNDTAARSGQTLSTFRSGGRSGRQRVERHPFARSHCTAGDLSGMEPPPSGHRRTQPDDEPNGCDHSVSRDAREREARGDPRSSIAERYPSKTSYLAQVQRAAHALVEDGYLLAEDLGFVVDQASERYDLLWGDVREPQPAAD